MWHRICSAVHVAGAHMNIHSRSSSTAGRTLASRAFGGRVLQHPPLFMCAVANRARKQERKWRNLRKRKDLEKKDLEIFFLTDTSGCLKFGSTIGDGFLWMNFWRIIDCRRKVVSASRPCVTTALFHWRLTPQHRGGQREGDQDFCMPE